MSASRQFAVDVVRTLQDADFTAFWAGGCVRDQLVGKTPKDYDVATNASPDEVRKLFGKKRTLAIGESFGVITVLGPKPADPIEVATFRRDSGYSDGRRPDSIEFTDAREDAIRRDFTINGMFFDPITEKVIDYVGGQEDLQRKVIRAIGDPHERIEEDKLRMLRAVRFASTFQFDLEANTLTAIQKHASEIGVVSGERIGTELRRMLTGPNRYVAAELLRKSKLLAQILCGADAIDDGGWNVIVESLKELTDPDFSSAASILIGTLDDPKIVERLTHDWKLSNDERKTISWILKHKSTLASASQHAWSVVQPVLIQPDAPKALNVLTAESGGSTRDIDFCRERLGWAAEVLDPPTLLDGNQLRELGISPGPVFGRILKQVRDDQLNGVISTPGQAITIAKSMS